MTIERLVEAGRALEAGQLEQAERIYRQVAGADPRSSIAVAGLARVAARRGESGEAATLAESALAIDPGNVAARRILDEHNARQQGDRDGERVGERDGEGVGERDDERVGDRGDRGGRNDQGDDEHREDRGDRDDEWPWPDLEQQLARYRQPGPGPLSRLLKRGRG